MTTLYIGLALIAGSVTATAQGFGLGGRHWLFAAVGGPAFGLGAGLLKRLVSHTDVPRWMMLGSLTTLALTLAGAKCAMCVFVGR